MAGEFKGESPKKALDLAKLFGAQPKTMEDLLEDYYQEQLAI